MHVKWRRDTEKIEFAGMVIVHPTERGFQFILSNYIII